MANPILSLALKINADASGVKLDPVERALQRLGQEADKVTSVFDKFTETSEAAVAAQERTKQSLDELNEALKAGLPAEEYATRFADIKAGAEEMAAAFEEASKITKAQITPIQEYEASLRRLYDIAEKTGLTEAQIATEKQKLINKYNEATKATNESVEADKRKALSLGEIIGPLGLIPGPLGAFAARLSSLASTASGVSKVLADPKAAIETLASSLSVLTTPVGIAVAGISAFSAAATGIARGLNSLEDRVERLGNTATKLGVSFEFVQTLENAANRSGTSVEAVDAAFGRLQRTLASAGEDSDKAEKALARIGVTTEQLNSLKPEDQYRLIGEQLQKIQDPAERSAAAMSLFGKTGASLIPFFRNFGIAADDMERYGRALSEVDKKRIDEFGNAVDSLSTASQGLGQTLLLPFVGLGEGVARAFAEITAGVTAVIDPIGKVLEPILTLIGRVIQNIGTQIGNLGRIIGAVFEPFGTVVEAIAVALDPLLDAFFNIGKYISDSAVAAAEWVVSFTPIGMLAKNAEALGETLSRIGTIITTAFSKAAEFIGNLVSKFLEFTGLSGAIETIGNIIGSIFGGVSSVFKSIADAIGGTVGRLLTMAEGLLGIERPAKAAADATADATEKTAELTKEQVKAIEDVNKELAKGQESLNKGIADAGQYGQEGFNAALRYQEALKEVNDLIVEEGFTAEQAARAIGQVTAEFDNQMEAVKRNAEEKKRIAEEARRQAEENTKRVDSLLAKANAIPQIEQDIAAVETEITRVEAAQKAAEANNDSRAATQLAARLAELDQLQARLSEQSDQAGQGFTEGFDKAFASTNDGISSLIDRAAEFGQAGIDAGLKLQEGIAKAQQQVKDGILSKETYDREVERNKKLFEDRVARLQQAENVSQQISERQAELARRQHEVDVERASELATVRAGSVQVQDIREGGIAAFFETLREDPAIGEARKQTAELQKISDGIENLQAQKLDILDGTG